MAPVELGQAAAPVQIEALDGEMLVLDRRGSHALDGARVQHVKRDAHGGKLADVEIGLRHFQVEEEIPVALGRSAGGIGLQHD